ncbi:MAG: GyrI-like domain-containing protein [Prevotellaceae bacterium]|jgi:AraC family transcriptional regulator|nr:GyrI-like domain-containing protein [Prevotellaceae bacterium]
MKYEEEEITNKTPADNELDFPGTFVKLWNFVKERKLFSAGIEHLGIYDHDQKVMESSKLHSDIRLVVRKAIQSQGKIGVKEIPGSKYAVFSYQGSYSIKK